jgi:hypothetical protein
MADLDRSTLHCGVTLSPSWLKDALNATLASGVGVGPLSPHDAVFSVEDISFPGEPVETGQSISYAVLCLVRAGPAGGLDPSGTVAVRAEEGRDRTDPAAAAPAALGATRACFAVDLWLKKVQGRRFPAGTSLAKLRRDLLSCRNECAFYKALAPRLLSGKVCAVPACVYVGEAHAEGLALGQKGEAGGDDDDDDSGGDGAAKVAAARCVEFALLLEGVDCAAVSALQHLRSPTPPLSSGHIRATNRPMCQLGLQARVRVQAKSRASPRADLSA